MNRDGDKNKNPRNPRPKAKKGSSHADVIDRLDFSGVGPSTSPPHRSIGQMLTQVGSVPPRRALRRVRAFA